MSKWQKVEEVYVDQLMDTTNLTKQDDLTPLQSVEIPFTTQQIKNLNYLTKDLNYEIEDAIALVRSDEEWNNFLTDSLKGSKLKNIELIDKVRAKIAEKTEQGFMEAAQKGGVLLAILMDKTYGSTSERNGPMFNVAGKQVSIKVGFGFKPYQKK